LNPSGWEKIFYFSYLSGPALGPTKPCLQWELAHLTGSTAVKTCSYHPSKTNADINHQGRAMLQKVQQRFIFSFSLNIAVLTGPTPHVFLKATLLNLHRHRHEPTPHCQCVISCDALESVECCTLCSTPVLTHYFGKWLNLYDIFFLHKLFTQRMSSSVCVMAKWLRSEDLLQAFKEIPSDEETTTDKYESDTNLSM
jgi:hypothetical protein